MNQQQADKIGRLKRENKTLTRQKLAAEDKAARLEKHCLELQHENAELRHAHKQAFAILRESH